MNEKMLDLSKASQISDTEWDITNALGASGEVRRLLDLDRVELTEEPSSI